MVSKGDVTDDYIIAEVLGEGGFGTVYSGTEKTTGRLVAIKYIDKRNITDWIDTVDGSMPIELVTLQMSQNVQGVVKLLDYYNDQDYFVLVMERFDPCEDLFDTISQMGYLPESLTKVYFRQIVKIVQDLFHVGVIHRDIKDENLLIHNGDVTIIDFGASAFDRPAPFETFNGTRVYAPPEWYIHDCYSAEPSTVWALGILLYDMITGDVPFETEREIINCHLSIPQHVPDECADLIVKCLQYEPAERISLADIEKHPFLII
jgi:serine/threonine protein kinase